jgi:signal transduction histidine kinase
MTPDQPRRSSRFYTVRFRVTALATLAVVVVLAASGSVLLTLQRDSLTQNLDDSLIRHADALVGDLRGPTIPATLDPRSDEDTIAQLVDSRGVVLAATSNMRDAPRLSSVAPIGERDEYLNVRAIARMHGSRRLLVRPLRVNGQQATLYVTVPLEDVRRNTAFLRRIILAGIPMMAAILAAVVWWLVGRTLRPVELIRSQVSEISGTDTHKRVPEPAGGDEIARLARTMNEMLGRIDAATARQQRFVADASHEFRTPLTRMRSEIEVDLAHPESADETATQRSVLAELIGLQRLVDNLLLLARVDSAAPARSDIVELDDIVLEEARQVGSTATSLDTTKVTAARARGDADQLRRVVRNLLDNAVHHAQSAVRIELSASATGATMIVDDDGPGIPDDAREQIFDRFTRLDEARTKQAGGTGLGLAIAREIVERHGGTISAAATSDRGARLVVTLPAIPDE